MATTSEQKTAKSVPADVGITRIRVAGYKSVRSKKSIEIRPLTILAGANSSGKSSMIQPLLLLKQTLEANYDPGALLLNGPNVAFTEAKQLLARSAQGKPVDEFQVGISFGPTFEVGMCFSKRAGLDVSRTEFMVGGKRLTFKPNMSSESVYRQFPKKVRKQLDEMSEAFEKEPTWKVDRDRCFLQPTMNVELAEVAVSTVPVFASPFSFFPFPMAKHLLRMIIHVPALRGNPKRVYPVTAVAGMFSGTFDSYVASVIANWEARKNEKALSGVNEDLRLLTLTHKVGTKRISDAEVEIRVGRLPHSSRATSDDLVSVADVGFGVSQALPIVVALHAASSQHLVYVEQPEIHLHPAAQVAMAKVLAKAVKRGVRMVVETHSPLLLLALQTLVAKGTLPPEKVILHWFKRSGTGATNIRSTELDEAGAYGDWPEDFGDVELDLESRYLDAAEARLTRK